MPSRPTPSTSPPPAGDDRPPFLLAQPLFRAVGRGRWRAALHEREPIDARRQAAGFADAFRRANDGGPPATWRRVNRGKLTAVLRGGPGRLPRVGLVCGGGLGKTTNLLFLEHEINADSRGPQLAVFLELGDLAAAHESGPFEDEVLKLIEHRLGVGSAAAQQKLHVQLLRKLTAGRVTFLLDSLDQAGAATDGPAMTALATLCRGPWSACPVWVSGRPAAFQGNRGFFVESPGPAWRLFRVGQLDEPEARELLDASRRLAGARKRGAR